MYCLMLNISSFHKKSISNVWHWDNISSSKRYFGSDYMLVLSKRVRTTNKEFNYSLPPLQVTSNCIQMRAQNGCSFGLGHLITWWWHPTR
jgi:hypothetical protein